MMSMARWTPVTAMMVAALAIAGCGDQRGNLAAQGAGVGAVGGALIGGLVGGQRGALIGAAVGGVAGAGTGYALGSQQEQFASAEQELQVRTERARSIAATQKNEADAARTAAARYEASLAPLTRQVAAGRQLDNQQRQTLAQARAERDQIKARLDAGQKASGEIREAVAALRQKGQNTAALEAEGRDLAASNARLQGALDRMNSALGKIEV